MEGQRDNHLIRALHFIKMHQPRGPFIIVQFNYGMIYAQNLIKVRRDSAKRVRLKLTRSLLDTFLFNKYKTFSVMIYSYINTSGKWESEKLSGNTTPKNAECFHTISSFANFDKLIFISTRL